MYHLLDAVRAFAEAAPVPTPSPTEGPPATPDLDPKLEGITTVLKWVVAPIVVIVAGIGIAASSRLGNMAKALTRAGITFLGVIFVGGATTLVFWGDDILAFFSK